MISAAAEAAYIMAAGHIMVGLRPGPHVVNGMHDSDLGFWAEFAVLQILEERGEIETVPDRLSWDPTEGRRTVGGKVPRPSILNLGSVRRYGPARRVAVARAFLDGVVDDLRERWEPVAALAQVILTFDQQHPDDENATDADREAREGALSDVIDAALAPYVIDDDLAPYMPDGVDPTDPPVTSETTMPSLQERIQTILSAELSASRASQLTAEVMAEIMTQLTGTSTAPKVAKAPKAASEAKTPKAAKGKAGRMPRRSLEDIQGELAKVVGLLKKKPGLKSEEIQAELKLDKRSLPRTLAEGLKSKGGLKKKGTRRSTTYTAT